MKIAIISDIHGNLDALNAVLEDIKEENCSGIFCLGDLSMAGPEPGKTLNVIRELAKKSDFKLIQGNTDFMLSLSSDEIYQKLSKLNQIMANAYLDDCKVLSENDKQFLAFPDKQKEIEINGIKILLVHGSPRKQDENIFPDMKLEEVEEMISCSNADIIFCGHTHLPCGYQTNRGQTVVNAGSVGRPFSEYPMSCYAVFEIKENSTFEIRHKLVKYDCEKAAKTLSSRGFEGADKLAQMLIKATSRYPQ